jgi:hypothetical protein
MPHLARAALVAAFLILAAATLAITVFLDGAYAFDSEKWGHDAATSEWFRSLRAPNGIPCCDYADGVRIEDPDWRENQDGSYAVFAKGQWHAIDKDHIITATNRVGYAIVWWPEHWDHPSCFLPGARG